MNTNCKSHIDKRSAACCRLFALRKVDLSYIMIIIEWSSSPTPVNSLEWNIMVFVHWGMMLHLVRSICERWILIGFDLSFFPCNFQMNGKSSSLLEAQESPLDVLKRVCQWYSAITCLCEKSASWIFVSDFSSFDCVCCIQSWDLKFCRSFVRCSFFKMKNKLIHSIMSISLTSQTTSKICPFCSNQVHGPRRSIHISSIKPVDT
jgi:hypothetical protein